MSTFAVIGIVLVLVLNLYVTAVVTKSGDFQKSQKRNQIILVWIIPAIGAILVLVFHRSMDDEDPPDDGGNSSDMSDDQLRGYWTGGHR